jgi:hypothetical protein
MKPTRQQARWIFYTLFNIVHGTITHHVIKKLFLIWIAPLLPIINHGDEFCEQLLVSFSMITTLK